MKIDDVGSIPVPGNIPNEKLDIALSEYCFDEWIVNLFDNLMEMKINSGVEVPCYPQVRSMIDQFMYILKDVRRLEEDYLVKENTRIPELKIMDRAENSCRKACISGPFELTLNDSEDLDYDKMKKFGLSLKRLVKGENIEVLSIDEPSLGTRPPFYFDADELVDSWNIICEVDALTQLHLHSLYFQESVCKSDIDTIDFPTAGNNRNLNLVDTSLLEDHGMSVRVGVSRTNIFSENEVTSPENVADNLRLAKEKLGDLIEFCGPDCGLRSLNSIGLAKKILKYSAEGINLYRQSEK